MGAAVDRRALKRFSADSDIAGVVIASSTDTHAELVLKAVVARKAIFCEKPISLSFDHVQDGRREGRSLRRRPACSGFQRRYVPNFLLWLRDQNRQRRGRPALEHVRHAHPRSVAAAARLYRAIGRHVPRPGDPSTSTWRAISWDEEIATVYAVGGCLIDPPDRRSRRHRHGDDHADFGVRPVCADEQPLAVLDSAMTNGWKRFCAKDSVCMWRTAFRELGD